MLVIIDRFFATKSLSVGNGFVKFANLNVPLIRVKLLYFSSSSCPSKSNKYDIMKLLTNREPCHVISKSMINDFAKEQFI